MTVSHVREALNGAALLTWARTCRTDLEQRRAEIDALNVFPIADADTGTNLLATMRAAVAAVERDSGSHAADRLTAGGAVAGGRGDGADSVRGAAVRRAEETVDDVVSAHSVARGLARGATSGARGNSGIILSQVLRGIAEAVVEGPLTGERLRVALTRAAVLVRTGLSSPVEGTILTVLDRAAVAAAESDDPSLSTVARAAAEGAARALNETPAQLGVLRAAGVVDAGARGLVVLLDCLVAEVCGEAPTRASYARERVDSNSDTDPSSPAQEAGVDRRPGGAGPRADDDWDYPEQTPDPHFEVMYLISGSDEAAAEALRDRLAVLGDSVVVVGDGDSTWSAHVHCRDAGAAIEAGLAVGRLSGIRIESFAVTAPHGGHHEEVLMSAGTVRDATAAGYLGTHSHANRSGRPGTPGFGDPHDHSAGNDRAAGDSRPAFGVHAEAATHSGAHMPAEGGVQAGAGVRAGTDVYSWANKFGRAGEQVGADAGAGADVPAGPNVLGRADAQVGADVQGRAGAQAGVNAHVASTGEADRGILAVVAGAEAARLFADAGAVVLRGDRQFDTHALLHAIRAMPHREVLVLPNGALPAQELVAVGVAARDGSRDVLLLPSASMVQGLAALAMHDRGRIAVDDAFAMSEAAATTRWGALRAARVRALTMVGTCSPGDGLGLVGQDVVVIDPDVVGAGRILLDRMLGLGGELVTLLMGADAGPELAPVLTDHVTAGFPGVEVVVYSGGQQADLVQIGVE
ncbi:DAK2 domain-containing protein [Nocardia sp. NPDC059177]|uniref:DAK2 domain-containing protein n=1 Tax=Nocardia sp. NPDC059177 TaxID=3346759 RepID=UPI00367D4F8A